MKHIQVLTILVISMFSMLGRSEVRYSSLKDIRITNDRSYRYTDDFPYGEMEYAGSEAFEFLHSAYDNVNFYGKFLKGDAEKNNYYIEKYKKLVDNDITFLDPEKNKEYYIKDFLLPYSAEEYNKEEYEYLFFDFDNDSIPELCISDGVRRCFFKYNKETKKYFLFYAILSSNRQLNGSFQVRQVILGLGINETFYILNPEQLDRYDCKVSFFTQSAYNESIDDSEEVFFAGLPRYEKENEKINIPEEIKAQSYYCLNEDVYYFRITEEQFDSLTLEYRNAEKLSEEKILEVTFTYNELFGD